MAVQTTQTQPQQAQQPQPQPMMPALDEARFEKFLNQAVGDMAAAAAGALTLLGHRLGLYAAMRGAGPLTSAELAQRTGTRERYVREWLNTQAAGGYVVYDSQEHTYELPPEQAYVLADVDSPVYLPGGFDVMAAMWAATEHMADAFRTGRGVAWHEHDPRLFAGTEMVFRPGYRTYLTEQWIPALDGVDAKLRAGARVADVGCGHGLSSVIMAQAYPNSTFHGFDYHPASIETARQRARDADVEGRAKFEVARAKDFPGKDYDLVCFFDCFHDLGDPVGAAVHARRALVEDGTIMLVEPMAADSVQDNVNPVGRLYYAASTFICTPNSLSQEVGTALGAQAGEARLRATLLEAGLARVRRVAETPFNLVLEAKP